MPSGFRRIALSLFAVCVLFGSATFALAKQDPTKPDEARLKTAYRFQRNHWVYVHLEGSPADRKSTRLNSSHLGISYAVFCLKKKTKNKNTTVTQLLAARPWSRQRTNARA